MRERAPITIKNRTNYFDPAKDKPFVRIVNPNSFHFTTSKQLSYKLRLYYEYLHNEKIDGQTFFYTLTYNDAHIPYFLGKPCFDYLDLAEFLNGGLKKKLERIYGTTYKYFVGAELGDGKGSRGFENNPHYHVLFFTFPANNDVPYRKISPNHFRSLVREYWQGVDQDKRWCDYHKFDKGLCKEGKFNMGLVMNFHACVYAAKYVAKDVGLKRREFFVRNHYTKVYQKLYPNQPDIVDKKVDRMIKLYRNRFCNKVRISQKVGDFAIDLIEDFMNPKLMLPVDTGYKSVPISLYYYRKIYTNVEKDGSNQNIYVLNDLGQQFQNYHIDEKIDRLKQRTATNVSVVSKSVYNDILASDLNDNINGSYQAFCNVIKDNTDLYERYSVYKMVYEGRYFSYPSYELDSFDGFPTLDYHSDFARFITPSFGYMEYNPDRLTSFLEDGCKGYLSYDSHPDFHNYIGCFHFLDILSDYLFVQEDIQKEVEDSERREIKKFHDRLELREYFNHFI